MRSWKMTARQRRTAGELGLIVLGVFLALLAQQAVEALNWRVQIGEAKRALHQEMSHNAGAYYYRSRQVDCVTRRLDEIERWVNSWENGTPILLTGPIGRLPTHSVHTTVWETAQAGQVTSHFKLDDRLRYAGFYAVMRVFNDTRSAESETWSTLGEYDRATRLDHADLMRLRGAISRARTKNEIFKVYEKYIDRRVTALDIQPEEIADADGRRLDLCKSILPA